MLSGSGNEGVAPRIGPWGPWRVQKRGGFPDWLVGEGKTGGELTFADGRSTVSEICRCLFTKIAEQADGYMHKDGGPVIGMLVIENEYGHAGGPSDREEGMAHAHATCHGGKKDWKPVCVGNRLGWCLFLPGVSCRCWAGMGCPVGKSYP